MRRLIWIGIAAAGAAAAVTAVVYPLRAADHRDSPSVALEEAISADIGDLYAWMSPDAGSLNLVMTVAPFASDGARFSDAVQYAFHVNSMEAFGGEATETLVLCTFDADQTIHCWAGDEYVTGDASAPAGITSEGGGLRVHAGLHNDPFFFNLNGFTAVVDAVKAAAGGLTFDEQGCPALDGETSAALVGQLASEPGGGPAEDDFAGAATLALVVQVDRDLVTAGGDIVGVWASSNAAE